MAHAMTCVPKLWPTKSILRKAQERSLDGLWQRVGKLLPLFKPRECANFFANAGYARS